MLKNHRSFRFIVAIIAIVAISAFAFAATSSSGFGFFAPNAAAAESSESNPAINAKPLSPQTVVLSDNFEGATTFLTANVAATNQWFIGTAAANGGTMGAYISNTAGATNAYGITTSSINHIYAPITVPAGESAVVLSFDWKGIAEYDATTTFDYLRVSIISAAPVGGVSITPITGQLPIAFAGQDNYTRAHVNLPASIADGAPRFLVFTWHNDSSLGFQPPAAIDNVLVTSLVPAPLSGTKSIPGDYSSIGEAIANVNAHGADTSGGSLTFNVAAGSSFLETPVPLTASGSSATNRIIFQKSGAGANPKITAEGSGNFGLPSGSSTVSSSDAVIALNGADFVTFDGIDVASSSVQGISPFSQIEYGYLIRNNNTLANTTTANGAQNNIIQNTSITLDRRKTSPVVSLGIMQSASTATGAGSTATSAATSNSGNKYYNLTISNAAAGIYLLGTAAFPDDLTEIGTTSPTSFNSIGTATANDINNNTATTWGIRFASQSNAKVFNNEIRNITGTSTGTVAGIHMDNSGATTTSIGTTQIYNNHIHDLANTVSTASGIVYGIRADLTGNAASISRIQNNFIYGLNSSSTSTTSVRLFGIMVQSGGSGGLSTHNVHNNSVRIAMANLATISTAFGMGVSTGPVFNVRNNIFANVTGAQAGLAKHYTWVSTSSTTIGPAGTVSDFNDLYVTGANGFVGRGSSTDFLDLTAWQGMQAGAGPDDGSISADPLFASATDLHLTGASPAINTIGQTIATVTNDIDNEARPNGAAYELGADEFYPAPGILQLSATTYGGSEGGTANATVNRVSGTSGTVGVTYTLTDGSATGGAACGGSIDYVNPGPQLLSFGDGVGSQPISVTLCSDAVLDANETFTITLSLPTGGATLGSPTVATVTIQDIPPPFNGTYTVGTGGNYPSLTNTLGIFEAINLAGATGDVDIELLSNLTGELGTHALNEVAGGWAVRIFSCSAPRTITGSSATALIRLNGADNVTIDGNPNTCGGANVGGNPVLRGLTIENTSGGGSSAVVGFMSGPNGAQNNTIQNVNVDGLSPTTTLVGIHNGGTTPGTAGIDNDGNDIINCRVRRAFFGIYSAGAAPPNQNMGTIIRENEISSATPADRIRRGGILVFNEDGILIDQNSVTAIDNTGEGADAFGIGVGTQFADESTLASGGVVNAMVTRNRISGVSQDATFSAMGIGVAGGNTGPVTLANNMVSGVISDGNAGDLVAGIFVVGTPGSSHRLYHNSVSMTGDRSALLTPATGMLPSYGVAVTGTDPVVEFKNNIFYTTQTAALGANPLAQSFGIGLDYAAFTMLDSNYNDFFSTGLNDGGFRTTSLGNTGGVNLATLALWNGATGDDPLATSQEVDPVFINPANDLHLNGLTPTPLLGDGLTGFAMVDHDSDPRPAASPEIGADELVQSEAGSFPAGIFYNAISAPDDQMAGSATITNALTLNGILNTGNFNTITLECNAIVNNAGGGNYVVGTFSRQYCGTGSFTYPVGTNNDSVGIGPPEYTPVTANVTAGTFPSYLSARVFDAALTGFDPANSLSRNWELEELGDITADLSFTYLDGAITDINGTEANYIVYRRNANGTTDPMCLVACVDTINNILGPVTGVMQFSRWSGAALAPTAAGVQVSGRVLTPSGAGLRNARVMMTDTRGVTRTVLSSSFGYYMFDDVRAGETYVISVGSKRFTFTPRTIQVLDELTDVDFTAEGER